MDDFRMLDHAPSMMSCLTGKVRVLIQDDDVTTAAVVVAKRKERVKRMSVDLFCSGL
jgi:hypothetical protein